MNTTSSNIAHGAAAGASGKRRLQPLHVHISVLFTALILISGSLIAWYNHRENSSIILSASDDLFERISRETALEIGRIYAPIQLLTDVYARQQITQDKTVAERLGHLPALTEGLTQNPAISAFYVGYANGDFFLVRPLPADETARKTYGAPSTAAFLVQSIDHAGTGAAHARFIFLDRALQTVLTVERPDYTLDPRTREWYKLALAADQQIKTAPYVFFTTREPGLTFARKSSSGASVVGADVTLAELSGRLRQHKVSPSAEIVVFDAAGQALAYSRADKPLWQSVDGGSVKLARLPDLGSPALDGLMSGYSAGAIGKNFDFDADGRDWAGRINKISARGQDIYLGIVAPRDELLRDAARIRRDSIAITLAILLVTIPIAWLLSHAISRSLRRLGAEANEIRQFNFEQTAPVDSFVLEINELAQTMDVMRSTIRRFLDISTALAAEKDLDRLLERVLAESLSLTGADVGMLYLIEDDGVSLLPAHRSGRDTGLQTHAALAPLHLENDRPHAVVAAVRDNQTRVVLLQAQDSDATTRYFADVFKTLAAGRLGLAAIPLRNRQAEVIGVLVVGRADAADEPFPAELLSFIEALSGTAAVSIEARRLLKAQKDLLDALIALVAGAIDAKSPYTGGHCERVPDLTYMLTRAACAAKDGPFAGFDLDEDGWEALKIAGGLHDCGKVTTPEFVVDKATKLETIYDRIHEVRTRFEVLKRDAEIACLKAVAAGGNAAELRAALDRQLRTLDGEFSFVAACNIGGEFMAPDKVARLKAIAARTWQRTLDDRLGVSWEENARMARAPAAPLPATESLLADKPQHVIERGAHDLLPAHNPWGFKLEMPQHLYNRGELYNLAVARGTLTEEERYKINDHIVQTIIMLSRLPFPGHLKAVPELAGGHHEKMDGTGYPKRLQRNDMSVQARIMAIADIFEALTAADRPYKKAKMLSEAVRIMSFMKKDRHIDPDLFDLFLQSGVYREYADKYLKPEHIDAVDVAAYLGAPATG